jgi:hypothetical protein
MTSKDDIKGLVSLSSFVHELYILFLAQVSDKLVSLEMENMDHMEKGNIDKAIESIKQEITLIQGAFT